MNIIKKYRAQALIGAASGLLNGLFGSGAGILIIPVYEKILHLSPTKSHPTTILTVLIISLSSTIFYVSKGYFDLRLWFYVSVGGIVGGVFGAKLLSKIPVKWLKIVFGAVIIFGAARMVIG